MNSVKSVFGIALLVAGLYYLKPVLPFLGELTGRSTVFLFALAAAFFLGLVLGAIHLSFQTPRQIVRKLIGIILVTGAIFSFTNYLLTPAVNLAWLHDEPHAVALAQSTKRPLLVDFQADWCLPCKELEVTVFSHPDVLPLLADLVLLKIDVTHEDATAESFMKKYQVDTLPAVRLLSPEGVFLGKINQLVKPQDFVTFLTARR
jgi:thiol:disulfide interchange protein DsbD